MTQKKKVVAQIPGTGRKGDVAERYAMESKPCRLSLRYMK